jgi:4-amino-4-deoxy-L-arabinose transferase-like glycosyltransferase
VLLGAILVVSCVVRVVYVLQSQGSPAFTRPSMDALYHLEWARAFAAGRDFQPGPFFRAPLYPWFLGLLLRVFGDHLLLVRLVQAGIGTASVGLVYLVGARAFDARTGLTAALFAGLYWVTIYFEGDFLLPVLEVFLGLAAIWLALRVDEKPSLARAACAGAAFGIAALVRPNILLFAPLVALWIVLRTREAGARRILVGAVFLGALAVPIAPVTAYNTFVGDDFVLVSSQGGVNFWIGNNPTSDGASAVVPGARLDWWGGFEDSIRMAEADEGRALRPSEVSKHYSAKAWTWIRSEPAAALRHVLWKLRLFWTDWEYSNNTSERFMAMRFGPILRVLPFGYGWLAPLALLGFLLAAPRAGRIWPLWGFLPVYTASVVAFFVCSRFRVPVLPVMAVLAAHACWRLVELARARSFGRLAAASALLGAAVVFVERVPASVDRTESKGLWELGVDAARAGDDATALEYLRQSIALNDRYSTAHADLGDVLRRLGQPAEAERSLRRALAVDPGNAVASSSLFDLLFTAGRRDEARTVGLQSVERSPLFAPGHYDLGRLAFAEAEDLKARGAGVDAVRARYAEALRESERGLQLAGDELTAFRCAYAAGHIHTALGEPAAAVPAYERALAARPDPAGHADAGAADWWWQCQSELLAALRASGRDGEANARRQALAARFPGDPHFRP